MVIGVIFPPQSPYNRKRAEITHDAGSSIFNRTLPCVFQQSLKMKAFFTRSGGGLPIYPVVILANRSILLEKMGIFAVKTQAKQPIATEKRILTPSGRLLQVAALVYRHENNALQVLLITSRGTGRWIIPKGWPQVGRTLPQTAAREAFEEAGIRGKISPRPIGAFDYCKIDLPLERLNQFTVDVYPLEFSRQAKNWPERGERLCEWVSPQEAIERVDEEGLKEILRNFGDQNMPIAAE